MNHLDCECCGCCVVIREWPGPGPGCRFNTEWSQHPGHWPVCGERGADTGTWPEPAITAHTETARHRSRIHSQGHGALDTAHRFCHSVHSFTISQSTHRVTLLLITLNLDNELVIILQYWHNNAMELLGFQRASLPWQSVVTIQYFNTCLLT